MIKVSVILFMCSIATLAAHPVKHDVLGVHHGTSALIALTAVVGALGVARFLVAKR